MATNTLQTLPVVARARSFDWEHRLRVIEVPFLKEVNHGLN